ncbi:hypothetical protein [Saccharolobus solfataricus]|uniref:Transposase, partial n=2 Tax=Saccharolobus solfataricus TaxID=2287 RepID=A0A157T227_SACSO|nr:hypothetical protein [Saccharolobus solfataricus]SAI85375.1 transposase [Saccharolobus solfataricus]
MNSQWITESLKAIATLENARWKNIMDYVIAKTERKISNTTLSRDLRKLMKMGFIEKENDEYRIPDPITRYTLLKDFP